MKNLVGLIVVILLISHLLGGCKSATEPEVPPTSPFGSLQVQVNTDSALLKLSLGGFLVKQRLGSGVIDSLLPGTYVLLASAERYYSDTSIVQIGANTRTVKSVQLLQIPPFTPMVTVLGGSFTMGCTTEQGNCDSDEIPAHQVILTTYEIGKYEVTQKEWRTVMGTNPSRFSGDNRPVEQVSWNDVITFCNKLSIREGFTPVYTVNGSTVTANWSANGYRLPTEAEWEYAARGGSLSTNTIYSGSNHIDSVAWYGSNSSEGFTIEVGTMSPNQLGIYDMSGNVWEWCWDWYGENYYSSSPLANPTGPSSGSQRVRRGGGYTSSEKSCRVVGTRGVGSVHIGGSSSGLRLARTKN